MKIAFLTTDNRENERRYHLSVPVFGTAPQALLQGFERLPGIEVHVISCVQQPVRAPEKLAPNLWYHALHVPKAGWLRTGYQGCVRAVRRFLKELNPDIVHGQGTERDCAISAAFSGFPNVITLHGNMRLIAQINRARPLSYQWLAARLEGMTVPLSNGVVCITKYTLEAVQKHARRTWVIPNAVDRHFFDLEPQPQNPLTFLCVGHIQRRKNQVALIRALDAIPMNQSLRVIFAGAPSNELDYVSEFERLLNNRPWCEYVGILSREELKAELTRTTALILPSLEDNCPMTVLEAMAAGVPVLATKVGGIPELITDGETGLLAEPTIESLATGITRLLQDQALRGQFAKAARVRASERFHPVTIAEQHLRIYGEIIR